MSGKINQSVYLFVSITAFAVFSVSFLIMPLDVGLTTQKPNALSIIAGLMFWIGLFTGIITQILLSVSRKNWLVKNNIKINGTNQPRVGIISFFKNRIAIVFDLLFVISLVGLIVSVFMTDATGYICYVCISIVSFSFCAHCIFNGKNYYFIQNKETLRKKSRKKKMSVLV